MKLERGASLGPEGAVVPLDVAAALKVGGSAVPTAENAVSSAALIV